MCAILLKYILCKIEVTIDMGFYGLLSKKKTTITYLHRLQNPFELDTVRGHFVNCQCIAEYKRYPKPVSMERQDSNA
jgi:hypothetical protein